MRITASHIIHWIETHAKEAQAELPRWIRRLCFDAAATQAIAFPAGDSTYVPGWDGVLSSTRGNAWVPQGDSCWEVGCDKEIPKKANKEYRKRLGQMSAQDRAQRTFVFVTPRRWMKKAKWLGEQRQKRQWADVRALDADDLEQWLEQTPAVAVAFAEVLGISGFGVESLGRYWQRWAMQCTPVINPAAFLMARDGIRDLLLKQLEAGATPSPLVICADSVEEATAFVSATLLAAGALADHALVVTEPQGWQFVAANSTLKVAIAADLEVAARPVLREGLQIIIPDAAGDRSSIKTHWVLERPLLQEFETALVVMGIEPSDASRYALNTGRSWTVLRRQHANNPAIRRPAWCTAPEASCLVLLCLLGSWNGDNSADCAVVERLAGDRSYEQIESALQVLASLDDAPVLCIGSVWRAKSPLDLLSLFGGRISRQQLDRFFAIAEELLSAPDPQLELPAAERWCASMYGKAHPNSRLLFQSVCNTLVKLAVRGADQSYLNSQRIGDRVARLVRGLLNDADANRWLSLASYLPSLAEAAPEYFLTAVEKSLSSSEAGVSRLITETGGTGIESRCWHAELLWALEVLAWAPEHFLRVVLILARLSYVPYSGSWMNSPCDSLFGIFRSWLPQTATNLEKRIPALEQLIAKYPEIAYRMLEKLASQNPQIALPAARPRWRDDDAGAGRSVTREEYDQMDAYARQRLVQLAQGRADRLANILKAVRRDSLTELTALLPLLEPFTLPEGSDEDRNALRAVLRQKIYWHRNYDQTLPAEQIENWCQEMESWYERLCPKDLLMRHCWLFNKSTVTLRRRRQDETIGDFYQALGLIRVSAAKELFDADGLVGIERLIQLCSCPDVVGVTLTAVIPLEAWPDSIVALGGDFKPGLPASRCIDGWMTGLPTVQSQALLEAVLELGAGWDIEKQARFLALARPERATWTVVEARGVDVEMAYWRVVQLNWSFSDEDTRHLLQRLLSVQRPRTALHHLERLDGKIDHVLALAALNQFIAGQEMDASLPDLWNILERLQRSGEVEKAVLIQLEFSFFPLLEFGSEAQATTLYKGLASDPDLFTQFICMGYMPEHQKLRADLTDSERIAAESAWKILRACKRQPGTQDDGSIDIHACSEFVKATRQRCLELDRLAVCNEILGAILAHAPSDPDGAWPAAFARDVLDQEDAEGMRTGFFRGVINKRGATWRSPFDGGHQERQLAQTYRNYAQRHQCSHPQVAAMLDKLAQFYERDGDTEDVDANLHKEGH